MTLLVFIVESLIYYRVCWDFPGLSVHFVATDRDLCCGTFLSDFLVVLPYKLSQSFTISIVVYENAKIVTADFTSGWKLNHTLCHRKDLVFQNFTVRWTFRVLLTNVMVVKGTVGVEVKGSSFPQSSGYCSLILTTKKIQNILEIRHPFFSVMLL